MNESTDLHEPELDDETRLYDVVEVCRVCTLARERLVEYVAHGVVVIDVDDGAIRNAGAGTIATATGGAEARTEPDGGFDIGTVRFSHHAVRRLRRAVRIRRELEVELPDLALVVDLMDALERQRRELERLRRELGVRRPDRPA